MTSQPAPRVPPTQVWHDAASVPASFGPSVVTIGVFDGVHTGHRALLDHVVSHCDGATATAVTFDPHPMALLRPDRAPRLLSTVHRRVDLLGEAGMDAVLVLPFTRELSEQSPQEFATSLLAGCLKAERVVVGANFRFGHRASGDVSQLADLGRGLGFRVEVLNLSDAEDGAAISSSRIRALLTDGSVGDAARLLGRPHRITGVVVHGEARGRALGFPTANLDVPEDLLIPADGIYAAWMRAQSQPDVWRPTAVSIGTNPTFGGQTRHVEGFALDAPADYDIYDDVVDVDLVQRLRGTIRFDHVADLVVAMNQDVDDTRAALSLAAR